MSLMIDGAPEGRCPLVRRIRNLSVQLRDCLGVMDDQQISIMRLLEYKLDREYGLIRMEVWSDEELGVREGLSFRDKKGIDRIVLSDSTYTSAWMGQAKARITVAHEIGHWVLHTAQVTSRRVYVPPFTANSNKEFEADVFAIELTMPLDHIKPSDTALDLAMRFGVSRGLAEARLRAAHKVWAKKMEPSLQERRSHMKLVSG